MTKFNIGDIVKYKKEHMLILDIKDELQLCVCYAVLILERGIFGMYNTIPVDVAGRKKA